MSENQAIAGSIMLSLLPQRTWVDFSNFDDCFIAQCLSNALLVKV